MKEPDGTVVIPQPSQRLVFTQTTVYGNAGPTVGEEIFYKFAYHKDLGLVLESQSPEIYARLIREAGTRIWLGRESEWVSSHDAYSDGQRDGKYWRTDCPANVFPLVISDRSRTFLLFLSDSVTLERIRL